MTTNNPISIQASKYYIDACFLLTLTQPNDKRHQTVIDFIQETGNRNITYAISNHVYTEVYNNIFKFIIKRALSTFLKYQRKIHAKHGKIDFLTDKEKDFLIELEAVQYLNKVASHNFDYYNRKPENLFIQDLIKVAKLNANKVQLLDCFYNKAKDLYDGIILIIESQGVNFSHLNSSENDLQNAINYQLHYQLDSSDSLHLAIAINNGCDKFVTLDGDFNHPTLALNVPLVIDKIA
ncbi:hypothetical protein MKZ25_18580 [Solibacillus sp. FSL W7-1464]|uniref:hypothetical protein n=1 Tax=Solibacillus sp. FSL W7-1464 TaxID=2921706 RepID=UPI0030FC5A29